MKIEWACDMNIETSIYKAFEERLNSIYIILKLKYGNVYFEKAGISNILLRFPGYEVDFYCGFNFVYKIEIYDTGIEEYVNVDCSRDLFKSLEMLEELI